MFNKLTFTTTLVLSSLTSLMIHKGAIAQTSLNLANVESLQNRVRIIPRGQNARSARSSFSWVSGTRYLL